MNKRFNLNTGRILLAAIGMLVAMNMEAQQVHDFTLVQAIDYSAKNSVYVKNALLDYQIQEQSNRATTSQALPQVTGNLGLTRGRILGPELKLWTTGIFFK